MQSAWLHAKLIWYRIADRLGLKFHSNEPYVTATEDPEAALNIVITRFNRQVYSLVDYRKESGGKDALAVVKVVNVVRDTKPHP